MAFADSIRYRRNSPQPVNPHTTSIASAIRRTGVMSLVRVSRTIPDSLTDGTGASETACLFEGSGVLDAALFTGESRSFFVDLVGRSGRGGAAFTVRG